MKLPAAIVHRRSLTFSLMALLLGLMAFSGSMMVSAPGHALRLETVRMLLILCIASCAVCAAVWVNLILDAGRGYPPNRCSLASVIMLAASLGTLSLVSRMIWLLSR